MGIPNLLTLLRIILIPVFVLLYYLPFSWAHPAAALCFALAAITDWLDGFLARKLGQTSSLGAFLDPVADKLIVAVALVMIAANPNIYYVAIPAAIIVGREIVISALREWMAEIGKRTSVAVSMIGKFKTMLQMLSLIALLAYNPGAYSVLLYAGVTALYFAAALTIWSMVMYLYAAWPDLTAR
jgi:CDP-diacylglycerol--glycerol-3-phosphate 3-phosphatidyltransferase